MSALRYVIDREKDLTDGDRRRLVDPLDTALAKAAAKKKAATKGAEPEVVTEPE